MVLKKRKEELKRLIQQNHNIVISTWRYDANLKQLICHLTNNKTVVINSISPDFIKKWKQMDLKQKMNWIKNNW